MNDFLPLNRKIMKHWLWEDKPFSKGQAWIDLLMLANYTDKKKSQNGEIITYKRGNVNLSMTQLSDRWGWDRRTVKRFLDVLQNDGMVSVDSTTHGTTVTIVNYDVFNNLCTTDGTTNAQPMVQPMVQQIPSTNKDNKGKERKEKNKEKKKTIEAIYYPNDEKLNQAFLDFIKMRESIKKPMTDRAITMAMNKLQKLAGSDNDLAIRILEQSILHCWQDVYELKEDNSKQSFGKGGIDWSKV